MNLVPDNDADRKKVVSDRLASVTVTPMGELRLYAISIDEAREIFRASPERATELRDFALSIFPPPVPKKSAGMLSRIGPLLRHPIDAPVVTPNQPNLLDIELLLGGDYIPPERRFAAWRVVEALWRHSAWSCWGEMVTEQQFSSLDLHLAEEGVPSTLGLRKIFAGSLEIPLRNFPGLTSGFLPTTRVAALISSWSAVADRLAGDNARLAGSILGWLADFGGWCQAAVQSGRPRPDLVCLYS